MSKLVAYLYAIAAHLVSSLTFLYAVGFVSGLVVPKSIETETIADPIESIIVDLVLISVVAVQHRVMATRSLKNRRSRTNPSSVQRSTHVLLSSLALILLFCQWQSMPVVLWRVEDPRWAAVVQELSFLGWLAVLLSTINHFELFGLRQLAVDRAGPTMPKPQVRAQVPYRLVRHPIQLGFILAFWATPTMTIGHLLFAAATTMYIFVGILVEESDRVEPFGRRYLSCNADVAMLIPLGRMPGDSDPITRGNDPGSAGESVM